MMRFDELYNKVLFLYLFLIKQKDANTSFVTADQIAQKMSCSRKTVSNDFRMIFGIHGRKKAGYNVNFLSGQMRTVLGIPGPLSLVCLGRDDNSFFHNLEESAPYYQKHGYDIQFMGAEDLEHVTPDTIHGIILTDYFYDLSEEQQENILLLTKNDTFKFILNLSGKNCEIENVHVMNMSLIELLCRAWNEADDTKETAEAHTEDDAEVEP